MKKNAPPAPANPGLTLSSETYAELMRGLPVDIEVEGKKVLLRPPEKPQGKRFRSAADLSKLVMRERKVVLAIMDGEFVEFGIRALDSDQSKRCDDIGRDVLPPKKTRPTGVRGAQEEYSDFDDPEYLKQRAVINEHRTAFVLVHGLVDFEIPGATLEDKSDFIRKALPPRVIGALYNAITGLTSDPIQYADFS